LKFDEHLCGFQNPFPPFHETVFPYKKGNQVKGKHQHTKISKRINYKPILLPPHTTNKTILENSMGNTNVKYAVAWMTPSEQAVEAHMAVRCRGSHIF
jgi:hypothetical protein